MKLHAITVYDSQLKAACSGQPKPDSLVLSIIVAY